MSGELIQFPGARQPSKFGRGFSRGEVVPFLGEKTDTIAISVMRYRCPHHVVRQHHLIGFVDVYERGCIALFNYQEKLGIFATVDEAADAIAARSPVKGHPRQARRRA